MVSITVPLEDETIARISRFSWVNWSEVVREKLMKREIFEEFIKTGTLSGKSQKFCDAVDWYPIDELPLRAEYVKKIKKSTKKSSGKSMTLTEFRKWSES